MGKGNRHEGFGMNPSKIRKMQERVGREVDEKKKEDARLIAEAKKAREQRELAKHAGMNKAELTRSARSKK